MTGASFPLAFAIKAVKEGLSANAGYRAFRAAGGSIRRETWLRTVAEVRRQQSDTLDEATRPLNRRPTGAEVSQISTKRYNGYIQQVDVYVRDKETGTVEIRPFSWRTKVLITRKAAINEAIAAFIEGVTGSPDLYNEEILGASYSSTLQFTAREME